LTLTRSEMRALIESLVEAYNVKDAQRLSDFYHTDARYWSVLEGWVEGLPAIRAHIEQLHQLLPDEQMSVSEIVTDGDLAVVEFASSGSAPVSGKPYSILFTEVIELRDGRIWSVKVYLDPDDISAVTG